MFLQFLGIKTTLFVSQVCIFSVFFCGVCFHFKCTKWSQNILNIFAIHPPIHTRYLEFEISQISVACEKVNARFGNCTDYSEKTDPYWI